MHTLINVSTKYRDDQNPSRIAIHVVLNMVCLRHFTMGDPVATNRTAHTVHTQRIIARSTNGRGLVLLFLVTPKSLKYDSNLTFSRHQNKFYSSQVLHKDFM